MEQEQPPKKEVPPSRYMRDRRPHLFSDSTDELVPTVTREILSYHLETLTNQKDETKFEALAHRLSKKFISPNLRPQTGPTGGGDGKTDAETYPVSETIASRWFVTDSADGSEHWAFAFSAKKDWRSKVKRDVKDIVGTKRGYRRIYFVTNQFVPARSSAEVQDNLRKKHRIRVTILDRTWILDSVFQGGSLDIAIETLGVARDTERIVKKLGPKDSQRAAELEALERDIGDGSKYGGQAHRLADDTRTAALLARGLERPRDEIDAKFMRAQRIAKNAKLAKKELAVTYDWAWTSFFWFEDPQSLTELYSDVERLAIKSDEADDLERLSNLLPLLGSAVRGGLLSNAVAKLRKRTKAVTAALSRLAADTSRPNNALYARALLLLTRISERAMVKREDPLVDVWEEFIKVVEQADGLGAFPFESIAEALTAIGEHLAESEAFDRLYEKVTDVLAARRSEGEAGKRNSERAFQKLQKGLPYEAIRWFGRAVGLLVKEEYEDDLIQVLVGSSFAYEEAGLLWASRNYVFAAASQQLASFTKSGSIRDLNPAVLNRLFRLEMRLGRVPQILRAHSLDMMVRQARASTTEQHSRSATILEQNAMLVGALLLRTPFESLSQLAQFPDSLDRLGLEQARIALLFLLGHEDVLQAEGWSQESTESHTKIFDQWYARGSEVQLPERPDFAFGEEVILRSRVIGCELEVVCSNNVTSIAIGEAILGALEAFLATSLSHRVFPHLDRLRLRVFPVKGKLGTPQLKFADENGRSVGTIAHPPRLTAKTREDLLAFPNWLKEAALKIFLTFAVPINVDAWRKAVFDEEDALTRALTFSNIPLMADNLFGDQTRLSIADWIESEDTIYAVKRMEPWKSSSSERKVHSGKPSTSGPTFGKGAPPKGMFDVERMKHSDFKVVSPIDIHKWDAAKWDATLFMWSPVEGDSFPPVLGLAFKNRAPAAAIFEGFRERYGRHDPKNELRLTIVKGISAADPLAYAVMVGPNLATITQTTGGLSITASRIQKMYPPTTRNLDGFLEQFAKHRRYLLAPAHFPSRTSEPEAMLQLGLGKYHLTVREAWEIAENDPDGVVLDLDDPPIIPTDQPNAPVIEAMKRLASFRS